MDSKNLQKEGFERWVSFNNLEPNNIPGKKGTYLFVLDSHFGRLKGKSDILYIGHSGNLKQRLLKKYKNPKVNTTKNTDKTFERIRGYLLK